MDNITHILAAELGQPEQYVSNVVALLDEGNTIPFIARYRKEMHGAMDDTVLRDLFDRLNYLRNLDKRACRRHRRRRHPGGGRGLVPPL